MLATPPASPVRYRIGDAVPKHALDRAAADKLRSILALGDIRIGGGRPWDIQVYDPRFYRRVMAHGSLAGGESYMDGWWDAEALDEFFARLHRIDPYARIGRFQTALLSLRCRLVNRQSAGRGERVARQHYDLGTDLYRAMLDRSMQYTCAYCTTRRRSIRLSRTSFTWSAGSCTFVPA